MKNYRRIELGDRAADYVRQSLADGGHLAKAVQGLHSVSNWRHYTCLPPMVSNQELEEMNLDRGILLGGERSRHRMEIPIGSGYTYNAEPIANMDDVLTTLLVDEMRNAAEVVLLIEDAAARPSDPLLEAVGVPWAAYDQDVYWLVNGPKADAQQVNSAWRAVAAWKR